jgi:DNA uptake protein ComE-like DNA-binding protein
MNRKVFLAITAAMTLALVVTVLAGAQSQKTTSADDNLMDINTAPLEKLMTLNGVDLMTARKIHAGRPYTDKKQLVAKKVMTQEAFDKISRSVTAKPLPKGAAPDKKKKG